MAELTAEFEAISWDVPVESPYSLVIVAHPLREELVRTLAEQVEPEAIIWDSVDQGCTSTHTDAWEWLADSTTEWGVVLEDDALAVDGFGDQLTQVLRVAPADMVSLYLGRGNPPHWQRPIARVIWPNNGLPGAEDPNFLVCGHLLHGVGYAVRTALIPDLVAHLRTSTLPLDEAVSDWTLRCGHRVAYSRPSLLDHRDGPSLIRERADGYPRDQQRTAWLVDTREQWSSTVAEIPLPQELCTPG